MTTNPKCTSASTSRHVLTAILLALLLCEGMPLVAHASEKVIRNSGQSANAGVSPGGESSFIASPEPGARRRRRHGRRRRRRGRRVAATIINTNYRALQQVPVGSWGGNHISLQVNETNATVELDCAGGTIDEPLRLDGGNRFDASGFFVKEHGGPVDVGEQPDRRPARFTGWTDSKKMTLAITLIDGAQSMGEFTLELGKEPQITRCL